MSTRDSADLNLEYFKYRSDLAHKYLEVERDITIKHYAAFGAITLASGGFISTSLGDLSLVLAGGAIVTISIAARTMSIFYYKYTISLFKMSWVAEKAFLKQSPHQWIEDEYRNKSEGGQSILEELRQSSDYLSRREFFTAGFALSMINTIPGVFGVLLLLGGLWRIFCSSPV